jgi:hypothetical protein
MKKIKLVLLAAALAPFAIAGCGSNDSDLDAGTSMPDAEVVVDSGPTLYALSAGTYCYDVLAVAGVADGCGILVDDKGVVGLVGISLPGTYDATKGQFTLGTEGSLGTGLISNNMGTLLRDGLTADVAAPSCTWHQKDTTEMIMVGQNNFTAQVTETQDTFAAACAPLIPTGGTCTSTWTWTFGINAAKLPATGCK